MRVENCTAQELFDVLNDVDETLSVEAKAPSVDTSRSIMETVCSFSNEPGLGGGVILLGVKERDEVNGVRYEAEDIADTDKALRKLRECGLITQRGKGAATYYVAGENFPLASKTLQDAMPDCGETLQGCNEILIGDGETLIGDPVLDNEIKALKKRVGRKYLEDMIVRMCRARPFRAEDLSRLLRRNETYLHEILTTLIKSKRLGYTIPEMPTHPNQMYRASD